MNFDKEFKSEDFFLCGVGTEGGGGGGEGRSGGKGVSDRKKKTNMYSLTFCAHGLYEISSSYLKWFSSFYTNKTSNGQVRDITLTRFTEFCRKSS